MNPDALAGRSVLVTRPAERAGGLARRLRALGATVELRPSIAFEAPRDPAASRHAVEHLESYDWLVFTSPTGVVFFSELVSRVHGPNLPRGPRIAAIGRGTAAALERIGLRCDLIARESRSEGLAVELRERKITGRRLLIVRPEVARPILVSELSAAGARVDAVPFYRTVPAEDARETASMVADGRFDVIVFTSPSTCMKLFEAVRESSSGSFREGLRRVKRVAIGDVTAAALAEQNAPADGVAGTPDDQAIVEAVLRVCEVSTGPDEGSPLC